MTAAALGAVRGRPSLVGVTASRDRARAAAYGRSERLRAERLELGADVAYLAPRVDALARVTPELGPAFHQMTVGMQHRLERMRRRAGSVVL